MLYGIKHNRFPEPPLDWAKCGTPANYRAHLRRGQDPCAECKRANGRSRTPCRKCGNRAILHHMCMRCFTEHYGFTVRAYREAKAKGVDLTKQSRERAS